MRAFRDSGAGRFSAQFDPVEAALLTQLAGQIQGLLVESGPDGAVTDPAIARLLPDAYAEDPAASAEFRRFTASELIDRKVRNAQTVIDDLVPALGGADAAEVTLDAQSTQAWLRSLTDMRLVLATRLGIQADGDGEATADDVDDEEALMLADVYDWLGWAQDSLVTALDA